MAEPADLIAELRLFHHDEAADLIEGLPEHDRKVAEAAVLDYVQTKETPRIIVTLDDDLPPDLVSALRERRQHHLCKESHMYKYPDGTWCCLVCGKPRGQ